MPLKKSARANANGRSDRTLPQKPTQFTGMIATGAIVLVVLGGVAAAMLTPREPQRPVTGATVGVEMTAAAVQPAAATPAKSLAPSKPAPAAQGTSGTNAAPPRNAAPAAKPELVTIAGCLQGGNAGFRLTDTTGDTVPTARSWKSGFLKKRSASVDVIDPVSNVRLSNHLDERVSVTGTLTARRMEVRSLRRISTSCSDH